MEVAGAAAAGLEAGLGYPEEVLEVKLMVGSEGSAVAEVEAGAEGAEVSDVVAAGSEAAWRAASEVEVAEGSAAGSEITALAGARASALTMVRWMRGRRRAHRYNTVQ